MLQDFESLLPRISPMDSELFVNVPLRERESLTSLLFFFLVMKLLKLLKLQIWVSLTCLPLCLAVDESLGKGICSPDGEPENRAPVSGSSQKPDFSER